MQVAVYSSGQAAAGSPSLEASSYDSEDVEDEFDPVYFDAWVASAA